MADFDYVFYGTKSNAITVRSFIEHNLKVNLLAESKGHKRTPLCIWGTHGIGKTELVETIAKDNNYKWQYIAPAQFEEMGDLIGMPEVINGKTVFSPPSWVPEEEGPGILLIDDVNRADDRILRGIMQLLQNHELISWKLPPKWSIILTANPDGGDYSVTPMDDAMLTRMLHISMEFDVKSWAKWAEDNNIDHRGINFVLTYPEVVNGRTTPRTLVQFFETIQPISDLSKELPLIRLLADACIDELAATAFIGFIQNNFSKLIHPEDILNTRNFKEDVYNTLGKICKKEVLRVDILATVAARLVNYIEKNGKTTNALAIENLKSFLKIDFLPNDIRLTTAQDIIKCKSANFKVIMADPEIGTLLLSKM